MSAISGSLPSLFTNLTHRRQISDLGAQMERAAQEVSTGEKADLYRALGHKSAEAIELQALLQRTEGFVTGNKALAGRLGYEADVLKSARGVAEEVLALSVPNRDQPTETVRSLKSAADAALSRLVPMLNQSFAGATLFAGAATDTAPLRELDAADPATGQTPRDTLAALIDGPLRTQADVDAALQAIDGFFNDTGAGPGYRGTLYLGARAEDGGTGARIDETTRLASGFSADAPAARDILKGLVMIAGADPAAIEDPEAYAGWMDAAVGALSRGSTALLAAETRLGSQQATLDETIETQETRSDLLKQQIGTLRNVDPFEAATRLTDLQTRLQASYQVSAMLSRMSFLSYMD
ncbi:hypothetical protein EKE94_16090 [Mesobaculum littorinae]|uniref:Flagellin C-terminal domain-containing protein n=1 Tax=Mesobaculum littorinae TaxID=2486419 RepID=A0A438ADW8_9RHOB|nr:flagellin [Mesobaculum littorinae]RVV96865.1 hypothetical protein EKE94_16090 [Mesobaculum littorinae]